MGLIHYHAKTIGQLAYQGVRSANSARVIGVTSKGIFLLTPTRIVLFISFGHFCSPLTINVDEKLNELPNIHENMNVVLSAENISFIEAGIEITYTQAVIWYPASPPAAKRPPSLWIDRLREISTGVITENRKPGFRELLEPYLGINISAPRLMLSPQHSVLLLQLQNLQMSLKQNDVDKTREILTGFLGMGQGLTPSGDDLIIGVLLVLNRWQDTLFPAYELHKLNQSIISAANQKTTTISENLIACAAQGSADERLIYVADAIFTSDEHDQAKCVSYLLELGNSSGVDSLVGMAVVITAVAQAAMP